MNPINTCTLPREDRDSKTRRLVHCPIDYKIYFKMLRPLIPGVGRSVDKLGKEHLEIGATADQIVECI